MKQINPLSQAQLKNENQLGQNSSTYSIINTFPTLSPVNSSQLLDNYYQVLHFCKNQESAFWYKGVKLNKSKRGYILS